MGIEMNEMKNAIELKGLTKSFGDFCLDHIDLAVPSGTIVGLVGENGAGKTTTIKLILDILKADSGTITLLGSSDRNEITLVKEDIGVVMDEVGLPGNLNISKIDNVMAGIYHHWDSKKFLELCHTLNLPDNKQFKDFSRGMKMKTGIAIALSHDAKLLILDEATSGLDPVVREEVLDIFLDFTRDENHSILLSSHIVSDLEKVCDYIAFIHQGKLLLMEEKDALVEKYGCVCVSEETFSSLDRAGILGFRKSPFNVEAIVIRDYIPEDIEVRPVSIEDLFVNMVKGER